MDAQQFRMMCAFPPRRHSRDFTHRRHRMRFCPPEVLRHDRFTLYKILYIRKFFVTFTVNFSLPMIHPSLH
ncbi:hypothetical protein ACHWXQ_24385 (plasmid) [Mycobacteroides abscessus]|uniref:hypothetical protein n=1 Tax=Mycobacteroides abscessus TaxID=36809 RepID=UPI001049FA7A|nr:hypothetical protein [Mycobacteroides abscessus]MBN7550248.1 hypothetical protein [Mycobacteroides abscessus subsp. abscessus]NOS03134.1 hypothetical protein [Mycobacteroides abscessus]QSM72214.1 hypothetical protein IN837_24275 [Mycobacteroides abscessus subsp. abscessus]